MNEVIVMFYYALCIFPPIMLYTIDYNYSEIFHYIESILQTPIYNYYGRPQSS